MAVAIFKLLLKNLVGHKTKLVGPVPQCAPPWLCHWKRQYDKASRLVSIEIGDTVFVKTQPKFKFDRTFHGPFPVYEVTDTNVKVN